MAVKVRERNGAWWLFIDWKGRRKAKRVGAGKEAKRAALAAKEEIEAKLALGDLSPIETAPKPEPTLSFRAYAERWLENHRLQCKRSTLDDYARLLRVHWLPRLGDTPLPALTRDRLKAVLAGLTRQLRASTIRTIVIPLQGCPRALLEAPWGGRPPQGAGGWRGTAEKGLYVSTLRGHCSRTPFRPRSRARLCTASLAERSGSTNGAGKFGKVESIRPAN